MIEERFSQGDSPAHKADPRVKLIVAAVFSVAIAVTRDPHTALLGVALGAAWAALARLPAMPLAKRLAAANLFIGFLWLFTPFSLPGETVLRIGPLAASREGIMLSLLVTLKANAIMLALTALVTTSPLPAVGRALGSLGVPDKLACLLVFTYRYLFVIAGEYARLRDAMRVRGFAPASNAHTYKSFAWLSASLLLSSFDRAERVHQAMLCRGFNGRFRLVTPLRIRGADIAFAAASLALTAAVCIAGGRL